MRKLAVAAGGALAVWYTLSPMSVWVFVWMALLFRWAASGTDRAERRWVLAVLGLALTLRVAAIAVLPFLADPRRESYTTYFGDALYAIQRSIWIRNVMLGIPIAPRDYIEAFEPAFGWSGYNYVLAYLHVLFGPSPYGIALFSTGLFLTAAVMLYRHCRHTFGPLAAFGALTVLLFLPSWFGWSVAPLKEAMQLLVLTSAMLATVMVLRGPRRASVWAAVAVAAAIVLSGLVRNGGAAFAALGAAIGGALWLVTRRWWAGPVLALLLVLVALPIARDEGVQSLVVMNVRQAINRHLGHTRTPGFSYRLLDDKFYALPTPRRVPNYDFTLTFAEGARFAINAAIAFFIVPLPWGLESAMWLVVVPQQVVWYVLVVLAVAGTISGLRRAPALTCALVGFVAAAVIVIAPNSGNVGTLIRHRDMVVPFVLALACLGGMSLATRALRASVTS